MTKAQNLSQCDIDGCSHRKGGGDAGGRLRSSLCHGQQRGHQHYTGVGDAEGVDIVEIQRMTGDGVEERDPFDAALSDGTHRCCGLVPVKCRQPADHRRVPAAVDNSHRIFHAKRGLLGIWRVQPMPRGDEPRQTAGEIADHVLILSGTAHCPKSGGAINSDDPLFAHMC